MARLKTAYLGQQVQHAVEKLDLIPWNGPKGIKVELKCKEFTSHCPVTKQPDFAELEIVYIPRSHLVETKSVKLFLWGFRDRAQFNEKLVAEIGETFWKQVKPRCVLVRGHFFARGGISVHPTYVRGKA